MKQVGIARVSQVRSGRLCLTAGRAVTSMANEQDSYADKL